MKNLLFYTFHRQYEEILYSSEFFNKSNFLKSNFDVILHCNNINQTLQDIKSISKFDTNVNVIHTTKNVGYNYGHFEALSDCFSLFEDYDMVIHLHPDCYIVKDENIKDLCNLEFDVAVAPLFHYNTNCYTTDFFSFKTKINFVKSWKEEYKFKKNNIPEKYLFDTLKNSNLKVITKQRYPNDNGNGFRVIDQYGLWHEHDNDKVKNFLLKERSK